MVLTVTTTDATLASAFGFARRLGKEPIAAKDNSGFLVSPPLVPYLIDASTDLERGVAAVEDIDKGMQLGTGYPMGPLALADLIGLDTCLHIMEVLHRGFGDTKYRPCPLLRRYVAAGRLGRKSGRGFYEYA